MSQSVTCLKPLPVPPCQQWGDGRETPPSPSPPGSPLGFGETLFRQGNGVTYRIPALLYVPPTATFLAFAEKRSSARDEDAKFLVLRRGCRDGSSVKWGPLEELSALVLPGRRTMNPCPLYDATSGVIFLFCICVERGKTERRQIWRGCSAARLCYSPPRGCQGSVVSFPAPAGDTPTWLLYSHPTDRHRRSDLGVYLNPSPLDGAGWRRPWVLRPGPAGYSDLAVCPGGGFGCLFECGESSACEEIAFCLFALGEQNLQAF
nr:sialidase-3 [Columba livia]